MADSSNPRSAARIEAAAKALFECDLEKARVVPGTWANLRPYYEADAAKVLARSDSVERPAVALSTICASCGGERPVWQRCPVCEGRGWMPQGFFSGVTFATSATNETCLACNGSRMVPYPDYGQPDLERPAVERLVAALEHASMVMRAARISTASKAPNTSELLLEEAEGIDDLVAEFGQQPTGDES